MMIKQIELILSETVGNSLGGIASGSRLREDVGLDSLQLAVLTVKIEAEFGVDVFADGVVTTVGEIEEKIRKHQAGGLVGDVGVGVESE